MTLQVLHVLKRAFDRSWKTNSPLKTFKLLVTEEDKLPNSRNKHMNELLEYDSVYKRGFPAQVLTPGLARGTAGRQSLSLVSFPFAVFQGSSFCSRYVFFFSAYTK